MSESVTLLRNLGSRAAVGIHTVEELREVGSAVAYHERLATGAAAPHRILVHARAGLI